MADVNEEIVEHYLKLVKRWFYVTDISFEVPSNYSNVDLLAFDPKNKKFYDIEVKYRSAYSLSAKTKDGKNISKKSVGFLVDQFSYYETRDQAIRKYTNKLKVEKILITTKRLFGKTTNKRIILETAFKTEMKKVGYTAHVWYFDDIIPELVKEINKNGRYNTQLSQVIRMLKDYMELT